MSETDESETTIENGTLGAGEVPELPPTEPPPVRFMFVMTEAETRAVERTLHRARQGKRPAPLDREVVENVRVRAGEQLLEADRLRGEGH